MAVFEVTASRDGPDEAEYIRSPEYQHEMLMMQLRGAHNYAVEVMRKHGHAYPSVLGGEVVKEKTMVNGEIVDAVTSPAALEARWILCGVRNTLEALSNDDKSAIAYAALFLGQAMGNAYFRRYQGGHRSGSRSPKRIARQELGEKVYERMRGARREINQ